MEAVWGAAGAAAALFACCGLPLLAALAMTALGRHRREGEPEGEDGGHACCSPSRGIASKGKRGGGEHGR